MEAVSGEMPSGPQSKHGAQSVKKIYRDDTSLGSSKTFTKALQKNRAKEEYKVEAKKTKASLIPRMKTKIANGQDQKSTKSTPRSSVPSLQIERTRNFSRLHIPNVKPDWLTEFTGSNPPGFDNATINHGIHLMASQESGDNTQHECFADDIRRVAVSPAAGVFCVTNRHIVLNTTNEGRYTSYEAALKEGPELISENSQCNFDNLYEHNDSRKSTDTQHVQNSAQPSFVEYPSEIIQKTTDFETQEVYKKLPANHNDCSDKKCMFKVLETSHSSMGDAKVHCRYCYRYQRHASRSRQRKSGLQKHVEAYRKHLTDKIIGRLRLNSIWKKTPRRCSIWSRCPENHKKCLIRMMHCVHFQHSIMLEHIHAQTSPLFYKDAGTEVMKIAKNSFTGTFLKANLFNKTDLNNNGNRPKQPRVGPSMFPYDYSRVKSAPIVRRNDPEKSIKTSPNNLGHQRQASLSESVPKQSEESPKLSIQNEPTSIGNITGKPPITAFQYFETNNTKSPLLDSVSNQSHQSDRVTTPTPFNVFQSDTRTDLSKLSQYSKNQTIASAELVQHVSYNSASVNTSALPMKTSAQTKTDSIVNDSTKAFVDKATSALHLSNLIKMENEYSKTVPIQKHDALYQTDTDVVTSISSATKLLTRFLTSIPTLLAKSSQIENATSISAERIEVKDVSVGPLCYGKFLECGEPTVISISSACMKPASTATSGMKNESHATEPTVISISSACIKPASTVTSGMKNESYATEMNASNHTVERTIQSYQILPVHAADSKASDAFTQSEELRDDAGLKQTTLEHTSQAGISLGNISYEIRSENLNQSAVCTENPSLLPGESSVSEKNIERNEHYSKSCPIPLQRQHVFNNSLSKVHIASQCELIPNLVLSSPLNAAKWFQKSNAMDHKGYNFLNKSDNPLLSSRKSTIEDLKHSMCLIHQNLSILENEAKKQAESFVETSESVSTPIIVPDFSTPNHEVKPKLVDEDTQSSCSHLVDRNSSGIGIPKVSMISASSETSRYLIVPGTFCKGKESCVISYEKPRCVVHPVKDHVAVQINPPLRDINLGASNPEVARLTVGLSTSSAASPTIASQHSNNDPTIKEVLSPRVYKALYETTKLAVRDDLKRARACADTAINSSAEGNGSHQGCLYSCNRDSFVSRASEGTATQTTSSVSKTRLLDSRLKDEQAVLGIDECTKTQLIASCRYYSSLLSRHFGQVKDNLTRHLTTSIDDCMYDIAHISSYAEACTMKPSGRQDLGCQTAERKQKQEIPVACCFLSPTLSVTNFRKVQEGDSLKSMYYLLAAIEGRIRRIKKSLPHL